MQIRVHHPPVEQKFWAFVVKQPGDGCWEWTRETDKDGYGRFWDGKRQWSAYIWAWSAEHGRKPAPGMELDHTCRNRICVRPSHLEEVSHKENTLRSEGVTAQNARKTACDQGHPYEGKSRVCKVCKRARQAEYRARNKPGAVALG